MLFPEMEKYQTVEDRKREVDGASQAYISRMRSSNAANWREARKALRELDPLSRDGLVRYWRTAYGPKSSGYLLSLIQQHIKGDRVWRRLRLLRLFQLAGQGRFPLDKLRRICSENEFWR